MRCIAPLVNTYFPLKMENAGNGRFIREIIAGAT